MKRLISIAIMLWCGFVQGAALTSVGTGNWSAGATWDTGHVPANGDTVTIALIDTVTLDVDTNDLGGLTITGTLEGSTSAGSYTLTCSADIGGAGTWNIGSSGTPLPSTVTHIIDFDGTGSSVEGASGLEINWYCAQPAYQYVKLSAQEAAGQTVLSVDTDVTSDLWADGDTVWICDDNKAREDEERVIATSGIASGTITITAGLTATKESGAYVLLQTRNIRVMNSTSNAFNSIFDSVLSAEIAVDGHGLTTSYNNTVSGTISGGLHGLSLSNNNTVSGTIIGCTYGLTSSNNNTVSGTISGCTYGLYLNYNNTISGTISGCTYGLSNSYNNTVSGTISGCTYGLTSGYGNTVSGTISGCAHGLYLSYGNTVYSCSFASVTSENTNYNHATVASIYGYDVSYDHGAVAGAFKCWTKGGITTSQTSSPPIGYDRFFRHACESATAYAFRQDGINLGPGQKLNIIGVIKVTDDHSTYPPRLQIIDRSADPLWGGGESALASMQIPVADGTNTTWQDVNVSYYNDSTITKPVFVRMIASRASGNVDEAWKIKPITISLE